MFSSILVYKFTINGSKNLSPLFSKQPYDSSLTLLVQLITLIDC